MAVVAVDTTRIARASPAERAAVGKAARRQAPRTSHADWEPAGDRADPVEVLVGEAALRLPELVPLRYQRMLASPFAFYRGAAGIMAGDLAATPQSGMRAQLCGDAHLANFGGFAAPDERIVFDVNDFDETLPGPWEWDLKRLVASFEIAARDREFDDRDRDEVALAVGRAYREEMHRVAKLSNLDLWHLRLDLDMLVKRWGANAGKNRRRMFQQKVRKSSKDRMRALRKLTRRVDGELRIVSAPPLVVPIEELVVDAQPEDAEGRVHEILDSYRSSLSHDRRGLLDTYTHVHTARKVVGVGSVGTRCWIALFIGRDEDDPLFLQIKEAEESVLEPYAGPSEHDHPGERVVAGQRLTQAAGDILLGWMTATGIDHVERRFYVRQLWDQKVSIALEDLDPGQMRMYAEICGAILARAHARTGDRIAIAAYLGNSDRMDQALLRFARAYADQNERDFEALAAAARDGRVEVAA